MFVQDKASDAFELMREARNHFVDAIELQAPAPPLNTIHFLCFLLSLCCRLFLLQLFAKIRY